jgi:hypothetical protein
MPKTYPFLAATLPTVRDEQFMGILDLLVTGPPFWRSGAARLGHRSDENLLGDLSKSPRRVNGALMFLSGELRAARD